MHGSPHGGQVTAADSRCRRCVAKVVRSRGGMLGVVASTRFFTTASCCSLDRCLYSLPTSGSARAPSASHCCRRNRPLRCRRARADHARSKSAARFPPRQAENRLHEGWGRANVERSAAGGVLHQLVFPQVELLPVEQFENRGRRAQVTPATLRRPRHRAAVSSTSIPGVSSASSAAISEKLNM